MNYYCRGWNYNEGQKSYEMQKHEARIKRLKEHDKKFGTDLALKEAFNKPTTIPRTH